VTQATLTYLQLTWAPVSIFNASLEGVLRRELLVGEEPRAFPEPGALVREGRVPEVLKVLVERCLQLEGQEVEGVFRRAAEMDKVRGGGWAFEERGRGSGAEARDVCPCSHITEYMRCCA
jgi:hypothetical protein